VIKGNIASSGERIYHVPGQRYYDRNLRPLAVMRTNVYQETVCATRCSARY